MSLINFKCKRSSKNPFAYALLVPMCVCGLSIIIFQVDVHIWNQSHTLDNKSLKSVLKNSSKKILITLLAYFIYAHKMIQLQKKTA